METIVGVLEYSEVIVMLRKKKQFKMILAL